MATDQLPTTVRLGPERISLEQTLRDFRKFRELLLILSWREISVRYKQTVLGFIWVLLQPLASALIFAFLLGHLGKLPSDHVPYLVFGFVGLTIWNLFSQGLDRASASIVLDERLVSKVYFPRWLIPMAAVLSITPDFLINFVFANLLLAFYGFYPTWQIIVVIPVILFVGMLAASMGLVMAALTVRYRDFRFVVPFCLQMGLFLSPVLYSLTLLQPNLRSIAYLNPLAGSIEAFRHALTGTLSDVDGWGCALSFGTGFVICIVCVEIFRRMEDDLADLI